MAQEDGRDWGGSKEMGKTWEGGRAQKNMRGTGVRDMRGGNGDK